MKRGPLEGKEMYLAGVSIYSLIKSNKNFRAEAQMKVEDSDRTKPC